MSRASDHVNTFITKWRRNHFTICDAGGCKPLHFSLICEEIMRDSIGNFELMILLALIRLGDEAYGVPIAKEIETRTGREISIASVYTALDRLATKQLVSSELGEPTPERGGRAKRYFRITPKGMREVRDTRRVLLKFWEGVPKLDRGGA
jgi:PadR family transcriptional regulator, regulatory protein PadR